MDDGAHPSAAHPGEIDERIALDEAEARRVRMVIDRREQLMSR